MFVHNLGKMMELVASLSRKLLFPIYGGGKLTHEQ